jgi:23S rRNA pseudouridine1911/1915/1917 synthase
MKYIAKTDATLLDTIIEMHPGISKQKAKQIASYYEIVINGEIIKNHPKTVVHQGQSVELKKIVRGDDKVTHPDRKRPIAIYFEDKYVIVALKPAGILSCRDKNQETINSFHKVLEAFIFFRDEQRLRLWPVHRLDKEVEGLIMFAKSESLQDKIKQSWQNVTKRYLALVEGEPSSNSGVIEGWLRENREQRVMVYNKEVEGGKFSKTEYTILRKEGKFNLLEITLHTGRKNQIRAHLSHIGCPIVGDRKYGADGSINRQVRLAAYKLNFTHPESGTQLDLSYMPTARFFRPSSNEDENYKIL